MWSIYRWVALTDIFHDHYRITQKVLNVVASVFAFLIRVLAFCNGTAIFKHTTCYFNDYILRRAFDVETWDDIPYDFRVSTKQESKPAIIMDVGCNNSKVQMSDFDFLAALNRQEGQFIPNLNISAKLVPQDHQCNVYRCPQFNR